MKNRNNLHLQHGSALLIADVQNDVQPGASLAVPMSDEIVPVFNLYLNTFSVLPIFITRNWYPVQHCSFGA